VGRVKTPTLAIVCRRELEIRSFVPQAYFEIVANAQVDGGRFRMRHAPKERIAKRGEAEAIAGAADGFEGPLAVRIEDKRQAPPRLHDLPSLQKLCGSRFGWSAARTLEVAQELYDGSGKKVVTYPRAETRYLPESSISDVPRIIAGLRVGRAFGAIPVPETPVIRRGANGTFHDKGLAGASHHAVIPNVNTVDSLREIWLRLSNDERRLFDVIARSYLSAMMPDFRYRQTTVTLDVHRHLFEAAGRQPIEFGWRAAFPDWQPTGEKGDDAQLLPSLRNGETALLRDALVENKETRPPPRYNEGTLIEAMQSAWRFVEDQVLRERLKEAKGIGTPATRAEIIRGLKAQDFLIADGKHIVPTERGLSLFAVLKQADPALVDPGVTAQMECLLDEVLVGQQEMVGAIDAVCAQANRIISRLREGAGLGGAALPRVAKEKGVDRPPTPAMKRYVSSLAHQKDLQAPRGYTASSAVCRAFLDLHAPAKDAVHATVPGDAKHPVPARKKYARRPAPNQGSSVALPAGIAMHQSERSGEPNRKGNGRARKIGSGRARSNHPGQTKENALPPDAPGRDTPLRIPFGNKEAALQLGARYRAGGWYAPPGVDLDGFRQRGWL
jgi:DNA topoisomerase III